MAQSSNEKVMEWAATFGTFVTLLGKSRHVIRSTFDEEQNVFSV